MNSNEARFTLSAWRPGGHDASDPDFSEAVAQAQSDPELARWFDAQRRFDVEVARAVQSTPVPADLRANILAGAKFSRRAWWQKWPAIIAVAAAVVVLAAVGIKSVSHQSARALADWQMKAVDVLSNDFDFDKESAKPGELQVWLRAKNAPLPIELPAGLRDLSSIGCKILSVNGRQVSLICFHRDGGEVHLVITDRRNLRDAPPEGAPRFARTGGWTTASWSKGDFSLMMLSAGPAEKTEALLRHLLEKDRA
jgi:hypothetical protein